MTSRRASCVVVCLLVLVVAHGCTQEPPPLVEPLEGPLEILSPAEEGAVYTNTIVRIAVQYPPLASDANLEVRARIVPLEGGAAVFEQPLDRQAYSQFADGLWFPEVDEPGVYRLEVEAWDILEGVDVTPEELGGPTEEPLEPLMLASTRLQIRLNRPPTAEVMLGELEQTDEGFLATFVALADSPDGVEIEGYLWSPGEEEEEEWTSDPTFSFLYTGGPRTDYLRLSVIDVLGGKTDLVHPITVPVLAAVIVDPNLFFAAMPPARCGCKSMTIRKAAATRSGVYCVAAKAARQYRECSTVAAAQIPKGQGCGAGKVPISCPLGAMHRVGGPADQFKQLPRKVGFGFEVVVQLEDGSMASECDEGQFAKGDLTLLDVPHRNPTVAEKPAPNSTFTFPHDTQPPRPITVETVRDGLPVPPASSKYWGGDGYTKESDLKRYNMPPKTIRWVDAPGMAWIGILAPVVESKAEILTFVNGSLAQPGCWCQFEFSATVTRNFKGKSKDLTRKDGLRCTVSNR